VLTYINQVFSSGRVVSENVKVIKAKAKWWQCLACL